MKDYQIKVQMTIIETFNLEDLVHLSLVYLFLYSFIFHTKNHQTIVVLDPIAAFNSISYQVITLDFKNNEAYLVFLVPYPLMDPYDDLVITASDYHCLGDLVSFTSTIKLADLKNNLRET